MREANLDIEIVEKAADQLSQEHWSLLLMADPDRELVAAYLPYGKVFCLEYKSSCVGIAVLAGSRLSFDKTPPLLNEFALSDEDAELLNIAIDERWQGRSLGKALLKHCIAVCEGFSCKQLWLGTANSSLGPLALYQKLGFRISHVLHDYFLKYPQAMSENGIATRDMLRLRLVLKE